MVVNDPIHPIRPHLQVHVGFTAAESDVLTVARMRTRDLAPPGDPISPEMPAAVERVDDA